MENLFAIGATIQLNWTLNSIAGEAFSLSGHSYQLHISCGNENALATGVTHSGNVLSWTFRPTAAWKRGAYTLWLDVFANGTKIVTVTYPNAFHIISSTASDVQSVAVQTGSATLNLVSSLDFYRFAPVVPVAGDDGYWYVNGAKAVDGNGEYILTSHTLEYDENTRNLIIDKDRVDSEGNSIEQVITALADLDSYYQAAEGSADGSVAGDGSRWGSYKTAENARNTAAQNAETARQSAASAAEGSSAGSVAGDGSRWGEFKSAEAERETASETAIARANAAAEAAEHMVEIHQGPPGDDGDSAYEIAVDEGFVGTEAEWLASLKGDTGVSASYPITIHNGVDSDATDEALAALQGKLLNNKVSQLEAEVHNLSGAFYGVHATTATLPDNITAKGYAFVGAQNPYAIYNFDGTTWSDSGSVANGITGEPGVGFQSIFTPSPYDGTIIIVLSNNDTITVDLNHNHDGYYSKVIGGAMPVGGFLPDVAYNLGEVSGAVTFSLASAVTGQLNHYFWMFSTGASAPTITWPSVTWAAGSAPTVSANRKYEISILGGVAYYSEV